MAKTYDIYKKSYIDANMQTKYKNLVSGTDYNISSDIDLLTCVVGDIIIGVITVNNISYSIVGIISATTNKLSVLGNIEFTQSISGSNIPKITMYDNGIIVDLTNATFDCKVFKQ